MSVVLMAGALVLLLALAVSLVRVLLGPTPADRMLAAQLMGTTGVGLVLLIGNALEVAAAADVTLTLALLAATASVAFVRRGWPVSEEDRSR